MGKVLYITANPKSIENSVSHRVGQAFLQAYRHSHTNDEIREINLYEEDFPTIDNDILNGWGKMRKNGISFSELNEVEQQKINALNTFTDMIASADKYVFVSPMWNWGIPPRLKAFIDSFVVVGKTFHYTENGPVGHLQVKKAIHIQVSGGIYSQEPFAKMDYSHPYLKQVLNIIGIDDVEVLYVEGYEFDLERADDIIRKGIDDAEKHALAF
ncbi:FMN-dependent NADH-azoreductase [Priestia megaterium]|jgi:FMN-dependent NADH-azoreductase|uniref:FMN dependent NADH:quinone oxidoreductase n=1 Tax=Priestia megaterium TaxID=1404 RepID=A0A6M6E6C5_PRIMG|nr:FMN-dependent NADH-azoreductase [Priestia megaterium]KLV32344.1 FMN-dependent NADH-azoreductase [Priestia megaterium]MCE4088205.1 FMN-dependent NADH-azoreductase [Priestia megaterium]MDN4634170.1 FMN-dependent NADH-azoreductase [Sphingomonas sp. PsM26]QJX81076.1 FMN-dependent NADH-azoreductase [Priestia megaterium]